MKLSVQLSVGAIIGRTLVGTRRESLAKSKPWLNFVFKSRVGPRAGSRRRDSTRVPLQFHSSGVRIRARGGQLDMRSSGGIVLLVDARRASGRIAFRHRGFINYQNTHTRAVKHLSNAQFMLRKFTECIMCSRMSRY